MGHFICRDRLAMGLLFVFLLGLVGMGCSSTVKRDEPPRRRRPRNHGVHTRSIAPAVFATGNDIPQERR